MYDLMDQDMVTPEQLDVLIARRRIIKFKRSTGWVDIRTGPLRGSRENGYRGPERRGRKGHPLPPL
jgi:hypothetical protein